MLNQSMKFAGHGLAICLLAALALVPADAAVTGRPASATAKTAYQRIASNSAAASGACDARDLAAAVRLAGKPASIRGTVANVYSSKTTALVAIDFDKDYKKAVEAVVIGDAALKLPGLHTLTGEQVVISGKIDLYHGLPEIKVESPSQIRVIVPAVRSASRPN